MQEDKGTILVKECCSLEYFGSVFVRGVQKTWYQKAMMSRFRDINQSLKKVPFRNSHKTCPFLVRLPSNRFLQNKFCHQCHFSSPLLPSVITKAKAVKDLRSWYH